MTCSLAPSDFGVFAEVWLREKSRLNDARTKEACQSARHLKETKASIRCSAVFYGLLVNFKGFLFYGESVLISKMHLVQLMSFDCQPPDPHQRRTTNT